MGFEQSSSWFKQSPQKERTTIKQKKPEQPISSQDTERINSIGELNARLNIAKESAEMCADVKGRQEAQASIEKWRRHKQDALNFAVGKIEQLPNANKLLQLVKPGDAEIIAKYNTQLQGLFDKGVAASLMTPEEKQAYYNASSRKNNFLDFLQNQYGIQKDASEEIYNELVALLN